MPEVPTLTAAPEWAQDEASVGQVQAKFKPYEDWAKRVRGGGEQPTTELKQVSLQNVDSVGNRINSVRLEVTVGADKQPVMLCADTAVTILPVFVVEGTEYVVLVSEPRPAFTEVHHRELPFGFAAADGSFDRCRSEELLKQLDVQVSFKEASTVFCLNNAASKQTTPNALYPGAVGAAPQKWYLYKRQERPEFKDAFPKVTTEGSTADIVPLDTLHEQTNSLRTLTALALYDQARLSGFAPNSTA